MAPARVCALAAAQTLRRVWERVQPIAGVELLVEQHVPGPCDEATKNEIDRMFAACAARIYRPAGQTRPSDGANDGNHGEMPEP